MSDKEYENLLDTLENTVVYTNSIKRYLKKIRPWKGNYWDSKSKEQRGQIEKIKANIRYQLKTYQNNKCAYCGLDLDRTSGGEIEHIAPKSKYGQFTFTPLNLVLACHLCNGFAKKGTQDTISVLDQINYKNCKFKIVHPYLDDVSEHLKWIDNGKKIILQWKTEKGKTTVETFGLNTEAMIMAMAMQRKLSKMTYEEQYAFLHDPVPNTYESKLEDILTFNPSAVNS